MPPRYAPPPRKRRSGVKGCFIALLLFFVGVPVAQYAITEGYESLRSPDEESAGPSPAPSGNAPGSCPSRIAAELPKGAGASLEVAYRTGNKQIVLCRTKGGELYYFGEFSDRREAGVSMRARGTSEGYTARNGPYRYEIRGGVVTIYESGRRIGRESLTREPSPT
ncbi:hypothetical protein [Streptomyces sp. NPDC001985]|uniref:hypothetical protein n=1 Tax=Streptomyces sp. NPDC001985 TaxID=3154406 RepID=UPI0033250EDF